MRKLKYVILPIVAVLVLSGCGNENKTLTCTMDTQMSGMETKATVDIKFNDDKIDTMKVTMDMDLPEEYKDQKQTLIDTFEKSGSGMKAEETEKGIRITADQDSKYVADTFGIKGKEADYDEVKEAFESQNYTCK